MPKRSDRVSGPNDHMGASKKTGVLFWGSLSYEGSYDFGSLAAAPESGLSWALEPGHRILMSTWSLGPLAVAGARF